MCLGHRVERIFILDRSCKWNISGKQMALQTWNHPLNVHLTHVIAKNTLSLVLSQCI